MAEYLKPKTPLKIDENTYVYPLTTVDQIVGANGDGQVLIGLTYKVVKEW